MSLVWSRKRDLKLSEPRLLVLGICLWVLDGFGLLQAEMGVLRGRLGFAQAQIFERLGGTHAAIEAVGTCDRRFSYCCGAVHQLDLLRNRIILLAEHGRVFHLCADACLEGGVGGLGRVLFDQHGKLQSFFSCVVDAEQIALLNLSNKETIIFELDELALLVGCTAFLPTEGIMPMTALSSSLTTML